MAERQSQAVRKRPVAVCWSNWRTLGWTETTNSRYITVIPLCSVVHVAEVRARASACKMLDLYWNVTLIVIYLSLKWRKNCSNIAFRFGNNAVWFYIFFLRSPCIVDGVLGDINSLKFSLSVATDKGKDAFSLENQKEEQNCYVTLGPQIILREAQHNARLRFRNLKEL